jgi:hypothetical protein
MTTMTATALALMISVSAHADEVDAIKGHLAAISTALHTMDSDEIGLFQAMTLDAQHHAQELAPLVMALDSSVSDTDIDHVLAQVLSLNDQLAAAASVSGAEWQAATSELVGTSIVLAELSSALIQTTEHAMFVIR